MIRLLFLLFTYQSIWRQSEDNPAIAKQAPKICPSIFRSCPHFLSVCCSRDGIVRGSWVPPWVANCFEDRKWNSRRVLLGAAKTSVSAHEVAFLHEVCILAPLNSA